MHIKFYWHLIEIKNALFASTVMIGKDGYFHYFKSPFSWTSSNSGIALPSDFISIFSPTFFSQISLIFLMCWCLSAVVTHSVIVTVLWFKLWFYKFYLCLLPVRFILLIFIKSQHHFVVTFHPFFSLHFFWIKKRRLLVSFIFEWLRKWPEELVHLQLQYFSTFMISG